MLIALLTYTLTSAANLPAVRASQTISDSLRRLSADPRIGYLDHRTGTFVFAKNLNFDWRHFRGEERVALMRLAVAGVWISEGGARYDLRQIQMWFLGKSDEANAIVSPITILNEDEASGGGAREFEDRLNRLAAHEMFFEEGSDSLKVRAGMSLIGGLDQKFIDSLLRELDAGPMWTGPSRRTYDFSLSDLYLAQIWKRSRSRDVLKEQLQKSSSPNELLSRRLCTPNLLGRRLSSPSK